MDNLSPHKDSSTLALLTEAGAEVRFLPAYSPDLNQSHREYVEQS
jgi:transposase